jgi:hypothetical protein
MQRKGVRIAAREVMQKLGYDPLESLVKFAMDAATNNDVKLHVAETLLPFMYPRLSNVTVDGEVTSTITADTQASLLRKLLENPELADAAQRLSIAAAESALETDMGGMSGFIQ